MAAARPSPSLRLIVNPLFIAVAAGLSLGIVLGYRGSKALVLRVGGPYARKPLVLGCAVAGACGFMVPAFIFAVFVSINLGGTNGGGAGGAAASGSVGMLLGIFLGIALVIASGLMVGSFAGALCARIIEQTRAGD